MVKDVDLRGAKKIIKPAEQTNPRKKEIPKSNQPSSSAKPSARKGGEKSSSSHEAPGAEASDIALMMGQMMKILNNLAGNEISRTQENANAAQNDKKPYNPKGVKSSGA